MRINAYFQHVGWAYWVIWSRMDKCNQTQNAFDFYVICQFHMTWNHFAERLDFLYTILSGYTTFPAKYSRLMPWRFFRFVRKLKLLSRSWNMILRIQSPPTEMKRKSYNKCFKRCRLCMNGEHHCCQAHGSPGWRFVIVLICCCRRTSCMRLSLLVLDGKNCVSLLCRLLVKTTTKSISIQDLYRNVMSAPEQLVYI